jgi:hypothetical protein
MNVQKLKKIKIYHSLTVVGISGHDLFANQKFANRPLRLAAMPT